MSDAEVFAAALALPPEERVRLADALALSLRADTHDVDEAWAAEIAGRVRDVRQGAVELVDHSDVFGDARERLRARRG